MVVFRRYIDIALYVFLLNALEAFGRSVKKLCCPASFLLLAIEHSRVSIVSAKRKEDMARSLATVHVVVNSRPKAPSTDLPFERCAVIHQVYEGRKRSQRNIRLQMIILLIV